MTSLEDARILIVDDQESNVELLQRLLAQWKMRNVVSTTDSSAVVAMCAEQEPDIVLLDLQMPPPDGFELMARLRPWTVGRTPVPLLVLSEDDSPEVKRRALASGASDFLTKPFDAEEVRLRVRNLLETRRLAQELARHGELLENTVRERTRQLDEARLDLLDRLASAAEHRDDDTGGHVARVARTAKLIAVELGLPWHTAEQIGLAARLHDLGKLALPDEILFKRGSLTSTEMATMKGHASAGAQMLAGSDSPLLQTAAEVALTHHERWDGDGYPAGLRGEDIPLAGRIVAVADVYDALCHRRPYREAWSTARAVKEVWGEAGAHFDPRVVDAFDTLDHEWLRSSAGEPAVAHEDGWTEELTPVSKSDGEPVGTAETTSTAVPVVAHNAPALPAHQAPRPPATVALREAAEALGVSAATLRRWGASGRIDEQRTPGGHRRFRVDDIRRLNAERATDRSVSPTPFPSGPLEALAAVLERTPPDDLLEQVVRGLYPRLVPGWFGGDAVRGQWRGWLKTVGSAAGSGSYEVAQRTTAAFMRQAELGGTSLLERHAFLERVGTAVLKSARDEGIESSELAGTRRLFAALCHGLLYAADSA